MTEFEMTAFRLPKAFLQDRIERDLPCGSGRFVGNYWVAEIDAETVADILDDAKHYAHEHGPDCLPPGLKASARAVVRALQHT